MPRLTPSLIYQACRQHRYLPLLLRECRDIRSARNELRWLAEHAFGLGESVAEQDQRGKGLTTPKTSPQGTSAWQTLHDNVFRRSRGEPLQYILGTQPFGELEIMCRKGVLIPRPETETYTTKLATLLQQLVGDGVLPDMRLRVIDLCTGTGCIALLLHSLLHPAASGGAVLAGLPDIKLEIAGVDISSAAIDLADCNLQHNIERGHLHPDARAISFQQADVLKGDASPASSHAHFDIVISNPPYISAKHFAPGGSTSRSVRKFEPKLALVPPASLRHAKYSSTDETGDLFYPPILRMADSAGAKCVVMEVGDHEQALRVARMALDMSTGEVSRIEIWDDDGHEEVVGPPWPTVNLVSDNESARYRAVVVWKGTWKHWREQRAPEKK